MGRESLVLWKWKHPPLRPANVPFCSKSFFILCFFFSLWMGTHVNFLKVLFNVGESAASSVTHSPPSLHPPGCLSPPQASCLCLPTSPSSETLSPSGAASHFHGLSLSLSCIFSHWVSEHNFPKHKAVFPPRGGRKRETLYLFCMCIII